MLAALPRSSFSRPRSMTLEEPGREVDRDMLNETSTDIAEPSEWHVRDRVIQLREWGTSLAHPLPSMSDTSVIGSAEGCWLRLWDPSGRISRMHASLTYSDVDYGIDSVGTVLAELGASVADPA